MVRQKPCQQGFQSSVKMHAHSLDSPAPSKAIRAGSAARRQNCCPVSFIHDTGIPCGSGIFHADIYCNVFHPIPPWNQGHIPVPCGIHVRRNHSPSLSSRQDTRHHGAASLCIHAERSLPDLFGKHCWCSGCKHSVPSAILGHCPDGPGPLSDVTRFETRSHTGRLIMLRLYCRYFSIQLISALEYKVSFLLTALGQFFVSFAGFLSVFFMFQQFHTVDGFTYQQVLLCFSVVLSAFSIAELFAAGFKGFSHVVSNGEFDRIMLRPAGTLFQTFASKIEFSSVGRLLQAVVILAYAIWSSGIRWTIQGVLLLLFMILCGIFLFMGLYIIYATLCFFTIEGLEFMNIFTDGGREFGRYPAGIYGSSILKFLTFIVPLACFQYYPLLILLGKSSRKLYAAAPIVCLIFFALCCIFWRAGVSRYKSAGS